MQKDILVFCGDLDVNFVVTVFDPNNRITSKKASYNPWVITMKLPQQFRGKIEKATIFPWNSHKTRNLAICVKFVT